MGTLKPIIFSLFIWFTGFSAFGQEKRLPRKAVDSIPIIIDSLQAVTVTAPMRPHLKGDTLEYNTEHIVMQPNAVVEELLRRLPGLKIDADGTITYNGEKIEHLLVDGEDIFGSNPTMVTRNFDAGKIARVQILDRKTDEAIFTGIDDGTRTKTLNLVMKESAKDGYFGKVEAGGNTESYYNVNCALAGFRDKEQFTALGIASNTGILGFSGTGGEGSGSVEFLNGNLDPLGASAGTGIPEFSALALHYANTWKSPEDHLLANYQFSRLFTHPITISESVQTLPDSVYGQNQESYSKNNQLQHWIYGIYDWTPSNRSAFKFIFHGSNSHGQNQYDALGQSTFNGISVNNSARTVQDNLNRQNIGGSIGWRTEIGKRTERIFSVGLEFGKIDNTTNGYLHSINQFYQANGALLNIDTVDERKEIASHLVTLGGTLNYTSPLWRGMQFGLRYAFSYTGDRPLQETFSRGDGKYQEMVDSLSSNLGTESLNQRATINLQGKSKYLSFTVGNDLVDYRYWQKDMISDLMIRLHYLNWDPKFRLNYTPNSATNFNFTYNASTQAPSAAQLQPVKNDTDPLHIMLGNPNLKPAFNQKMQIEFSRYKAWLINIGMNIGMANRSISMKTIVDSLGRQINQPVNVDGGRSGGLNVSANRKIFQIDMGVFSGFSYSQNVSYINDDASRNDVFSGSGGVSFTRYVESKYFVQVSTNFKYFTQMSSINSSAATRYWTQNHQGALTLFFIKGFELNTNAVYNWQERTGAFAGNASVLIWNGYISRRFCHNNLVTRFQFNNILNANAGISRSNVANVNMQTSTNIIGRYWMFSAIYHFDSKFKRK